MSRHEFDSEQIPDLSKDLYRQDIHSVGSLCKLYFRELPNPLLTYQLYDRFSVSISGTAFSKFNGSLFSVGSKQIESACFSGTAAFMEVRIQSVVVEFILNNTESLFSPKLNAIIRESTGQALNIICPLCCSSKRPLAKSKKSPVGNWLSFFHLGKSHSVSKRKLKRHPSEPNEIKSIALPDFDPMSFQCSQTPAMQHSREGNRWRKSVGCSSESEPMSSQKNIGCSHSPDVSPALCKSGKKVALKHLSPKVRKKSLKMLADVQNPAPSSSPNVDKCEAAVADGKEPRALFQHSSPITTTSQASAVTDLSQSAQNLPDPDRLMSSVSVLPPHPPSMSAARKLALALAESAQKASTASQRRSHEHDYRLQRPCVLDLKVHPPEYRGLHISSGSQWQAAAETRHCPHPVQFSPSHPFLEPLQVGEGRTPVPHYPRPSALPPHLSGHKGLYRQSSESRYSSLGLKQPLSPQYRCYQSDFHRQQGQWQSSEDRAARNPAIRRAHSFHAPQISHYELAKPEILPVDTMFYVEQKTSPEMPYQGLIQAGLNPVRTQFEKVRPEHHYSPYSDSNSGDPRSRYFIDPHRQSGIHRHQTYTVHSTREGEQSDYYNYSPRHAPPVNRELYIESRDTVVYEASDAEVFESVVYQPVQQERHKSTYHSVSPCETADSPRDIMHTRSKSDPGNANFLSAHNMEGQTTVATSPTSTRIRSQQAYPQVTRQSCGHRSGTEFGPTRRIHMKEGYSQQPLLRKVPSLPERGCPNLKSIEHSHRCQTRGFEQNPSMLAGAAKPSILRRPLRSQSTREHRHYYHYHSKSPLDPEHLESFPAQLNRRTQSTKVKPTHHDHMEGYYAAPRSKSTRSGKAATGYLPGQSCMSPHGQRLLSKVMGHEAFYHPALRSEAGVYE
ncbi:hypothetical protein GOODEAATRI_015519 [Goodea atripinnis]|uniref:Rho-GAP domain-containing protein n=1 Tax=Goodea atripinnis TaxID=208336 RepID=A0ABV0NUT8_9TELE